MENVWNNKNLKSPPIYTFKCERPILGQAEMSSICKDLENSLSIEENLKIETAMLTKMIYKTNNKLRFDKGFQNAKKVKRCVQRYLDINTVEVVKYFSSCLPTLKVDVYMPSRQMLQYLLVRLMGLARLLHQAVLYCKTAGKFLIKRVCLGQSWNLATMFLGIISRIWSICQSRVLAICKAYHGLITFVPYLIPTEAAWLPENFNLPEDLCAWLQLELSEAPKSGNLVIDPLLSDKIFSLLTEGDEEDEDVVILQDDVSLTMPKTTLTSPSVVKNSRQVAVASNQEEEDLGESLSSLENADNKLLKQKITAINNSRDLIKFVSQELSSTNQIHIKLQCHLKSLIKDLHKNERLNHSKKNSKLIRKAKHMLLKEI